MQVTEQGLRLVRQFCAKYPLISGKFGVLKDYCNGKVADSDFRDNLRFIKESVVLSYPEYSVSLSADLNLLSSYFEGRLKGKMVNIAARPKENLSGTLIKKAYQKEPDLARFYLPQKDEKLSLSQKNDRIIQYEEYLRKVVAPLVRKYGATFAQVLSGSVDALHGSDASNYLDNQNLIKKYSMPVKLKVPQMGFGFVYYTRRDTIWLAKKYPKLRYKFYLSCRIKNDSEYAKSQQFLDELLSTCFKDKISIGSKIEDHNYDSFNIYTWDRNQMADILSELYRKYVVIFNQVYHFFQAKVEGISPMHIGWAQEPLGGSNGESHSGRMRLLGNGLDHGLSFVQSCRAAHIKPESPWLIDG